MGTVVAASSARPDLDAAATTASSGLEDLDAAATTAPDNLDRPLASVLSALPIAPDRSFLTEATTPSARPDSNAAATTASSGHEAVDAATTTAPDNPGRPLTPVSLAPASSA